MENKGLPPNKFKVELVAEVGTSEEFLKRMSELPLLVDAGDIDEPQRENVKSAIIAVLMEGLIPAFLKLREIRAPANRSLPLMDRQQLFEDFARKLWKAYKDLMERAAREMGFSIGFLFTADNKFREGLADFRGQHPGLQDWFEGLLEHARENWQNELAQFRNTWLEHMSADRKQFAKFYTVEHAEFLFDGAWRTIADILPALLELHFPPGIRLIEQDKNDPNPRWERRFRFTLPGVAEDKSSP